MSRDKVKARGTGQHGAAQGQSKREIKRKGIGRGILHTFEPHSMHMHASALSPDKRVRIRTGNSENKDGWTER